MERRFALFLLLCFLVLGGVFALAAHEHFVSEYWRKQYDAEKISARLVLMCRTRVQEVYRQYPQLSEIEAQCPEPEHWEIWGKLPVTIPPPDDHHGDGWKPPAVRSVQGTDYAEINGNAADDVAFWIDRLTACERRDSNPLKRRRFHER